MMNPYYLCSMQISKLNVDKARHISIGKQKYYENQETTEITKAGKILCAHKCLPFVIAVEYCVTSSRLSIV